MCKAWASRFSWRKRNLLAATGTLICRNTQIFGLRGCLGDQANISQPKQVEIESKFVEINQNNLKDLVSIGC